MRCLRAPRLRSVRGMSVVLFGTYLFERFRYSLPPSQLTVLPIPLPPVGYMLVLAASHCQRFTLLAELSLESMPCGRLPVTSPGRNGFPGRLAVLSYTMCGTCATLVLLYLSCWPIISSGDWLTGLVAPAHHVLAPLPSSSVVGSPHVAFHAAVRLVLLACVQP